MTRRDTGRIRGWRITGRLLPFATVLVVLAAVIAHRWLSAMVLAVVGLVATVAVADLRPTTTDTTTTTDTSAGESR